MARPAAIQIKDAFSVIEDTRNDFVSDEMRNREPRYLFFAGDEPGLPEPGGMAVASPVIPNKILWRCAVTPAISAPVRMRAVEIPDGREMDGTRDARGIASMLLPCGPEVDEMLAQYGHSDVAQWQRRWGLVELTEFRGMEPKAVAALNLTALFFPDYPNIPDTNKEILAHLEARRVDIEASVSDLPLRAKLLNTADQMMAAVRQAQEYQVQTIRQGNIRVTYPDSNDAHKPGFDAKDELFSARSGAPLAVNSLRGNQSDATAAGIEAVLDKVLSKVIPQQAAAPLDPNAIAAIVAATMQALKAEEKKATDEPKETKLPVKK